jgi:hypothetical protein
MESVIWNICSKWRDQTFQTVINQLKENFKPSFNCALPFPADFKTSVSEIHREDEKEWKKEREPDEPIDFAGYQQYKREVSALLKKWTGKDDFRLTTAYIDGVFACEICGRAGCNGRTPKVLRNGCAGYLSKEKADEIAATRPPAGSRRS